MMSGRPTHLRDFWAAVFLDVPWPCGGLPDRRLSDPSTVRMAEVTCEECLLILSRLDDARQELMRDSLMGAWCPT